jgi:hypothetical protein
VLLPVAVAAVLKHIVAKYVDATHFRLYVYHLVEENRESSKGFESKFPQLHITRNAYPRKTKKEILLSIIPWSY